MAKKTFEKPLNRGRETFDFNDKSYNPDDHTEDVINDFRNEPTKEKMPIVLRAVETDSRLSVEIKNDIIERLKTDFAYLFSRDIPDDYQSLKEESKLLAKFAQTSFVLLAIRLKKIRDEELYREDKYTDFKSFVESELDIARSTAYNYIDLVSVFGARTFENSKIDPSKLISAIPLLRMNGVPVDSIKKEIISDARNLSAREISEKVKLLKEEYSPKPKTKSKSQIVQTAEDIKFSIRSGLKGLSAKDKKAVVAALKKFIESL
jgi:hypothetical protein